MRALGETTVPVRLGRPIATLECNKALGHHTSCLEKKAELPTGVHGMLIGNRVGARLTRRTISPKFPSLFPVEGVLVNNIHLVVGRGQDNSH